MEPWSITVTGSKTEIQGALAKAKAPKCLVDAATALLEPLAEVPGFTEEDPNKEFEGMSQEAWTKMREMAHPDVRGGYPLIRPRTRKERGLVSYWRLTSAGHPGAHGITDLRIEGVYEEGVK